MAIPAGISHTPAKIVKSDTLQNPIGFMTRIALFLPAKHTSYLRATVIRSASHDVHELIPASVLINQWR
jgi:hypothetical protein